jgi:hypothetical protein
MITYGAKQVMCENLLGMIFSTMPEVAPGLLRGHDLILALVFKQVSVSLAGKSASPRCRSRPCVDPAPVSSQWNGLFKRDLDLAHMLSSFRFLEFTLTLRLGRDLLYTPCFGTTAFVLSRSNTNFAGIG